MPFFFPHSFSVITVNCNNRGRIQINEFERHSLPYLLTPISKPFLVSIYLFCSPPIKSQCYKIFELSLATTITVLKPVSCDHVISFNYDGKRARDVGLTC